MKWRGRKNDFFFQKMARAMVYESATPDTFRGEASHTAINILKNTHVRVNSDRNLYKLWNGRHLL